MKPGIKKGIKPGTKKGIKRTLITGGFVASFFLGAMSVYFDSKYWKDMKEEAKAEVMAQYNTDLTKVEKLEDYPNIDGMEEVPTRQQFRQLIGVTDFDEAREIMGYGGLVSEETSFETEGQTVYMFANIDDDNSERFTITVNDDTNKIITVASDSFGMLLRGKTTNETINDIAPE